MSIKIDEALCEYVAALHTVYGEHLKKVILYGSYARGDYREDSDIDIMILVDVDRENISHYRHQLSDKTFDINFDNDISIMPIVENESFFMRWIGAHPFYNNVNNEGVEIYAA